MKVLKSGNLADPNSWRGEYVCGNCRAVLEVRKSDLRYQAEDQSVVPHLQEPPYHYIVCPECLSRTKISNVPRFRPTYTKPDRFE